MLTIGDYVTFRDSLIILKIGADIKGTYTVTLLSKQMEAESINALQWGTITKERQSSPPDDRKTRAYLRSA